MMVRGRWAKRFETVNGFGIAWILSLGLLAGVLYPVAVAYWYNNLGDLNGDWVHHLFLRKEVALQLAGEGPRLLTVGGSGCLFSVDAEALQRELQQPVVNLCSHAGVGLEYMLARARRHARPGDTVLLIPEYRVLSVPDPMHQSIEWIYASTWDRQHYLEHGLPDIYRLLYRIPLGDLWKSREGWRQWRGGYEPKLHQIYDVTLMTPNGDLHESLGKRPTLAGRLDLTYLPPIDLARQLFEQFAAWGRSHNVRILATYQPAALERSGYWRKEDLFRMLPQWWKDRGIETIGTPEQALWPNEGFMDTLQHAGPGVSYVSAVRIAREIRNARPAKERLLIPAHAQQPLLPLPSRAGAEVDIYWGTPEDDDRIRAFQKEGGRIFAAARSVADTLQGHGFRVQPVTTKKVSPAEVLQANRDHIVAICARPDAPAQPGLAPLSPGRAWAGLWRQGIWTGADGANETVWKDVLHLPLATGVAIPYRFALQASRTGCAMQFQQRDRAPAPEAVLRMFVLDSRRGILQGIYNFGPDLQMETQWVGEIVAP